MNLQPPELAAAERLFTLAIKCEGRPNLYNPDCVPGWIVVPRETGSWLAVMANQEPVRPA